MKILQIVHSFPPENIAGTEIYTYQLCRALSKRHDSFVFYRICDLKKREYEVNYNKFDGLDIYTINNTFRFCNSFEGLYRNNAITDQLVKILNIIKPHIVHIQHLIFLSTTIIAEVKKRKIPIIFTLHDYWLICPQWHCLKKDLSICDNNDLSQCIECLDFQLNIKKLPKRLYLFLRNFVPTFLTRFFKKAYLNFAKTNLDTQAMFQKLKTREKHIRELCSTVNLFIAPSHYLKTRFIEFGIPENKIKLIPHGISTAPFKNFKRKASGRIRFGFIGTILPAKGLDLLVNAFNRIKDAQRAELKIYGRLFPYQGFEYYPGYIKRLKKNKNIRFMGDFRCRDVGSVFSEIDILVVPSIWHENLPLVILEAFLTKTPVIASRIGGIPELVKDQDNGLLFTPRDADDLYDKLEIFINNPDLIKRFRIAIKQPKDIEKNGQEIEELYKELLSND